MSLDNQSQAVNALKEEELLGVDQMPMPMDSEEALQGFALALKDVNEPLGEEEVNANQSIREEVEAEG